MGIEELVKQKYGGFIDLCRAHRVDKMYAFGSSAIGKFDPKKSDIDILVTVDISDPADRGDALFSLWDRLEVLFGAKVDLLTEDSLKNPYLKRSVERTKVLIYDRKREQVFV